MANKNNGNEEKQEELSAEDYAIIAAGLTALGDFFAFLSLIKAKEITKETGEAPGAIPLVYIRSKKRKRY
ncbi:hypothetical protein [Paenibacillus wynnii]|uniref:hypothetical protein n=1 Tax=Paenibacillus wynnii TaxID=268407 RepID=UPI002791FA1B|nr:hypothetical protein [Paenibacillus wynnii]MDQ0192483.1 hypothetical protein [Paenibacillus wynnii]